MRALLVGLAATAALTIAPAPANAVVDCQDRQPCFCGTEIGVGVPNKDPIISLGRIDC